MSILDFIAPDVNTSAGALRGSDQLESIGRQSVQAGDASRGIFAQVLDAGRMTVDAVQTATSNARDRVSRGFDASLGILERTRQSQRPGSTFNAGEQRRINLRRALSGVDATNRALGGLHRDRDTARLAAGGIMDLLTGQAGAAATGRAEAEAGREVQFQQETLAGNRAAFESIGEIAGLVGGGFG